MSNEANRADEQSLIVNQLIAEFMSRTDAGENLDVAQFLKEHSEHAAELEKHFANVDLLDGLKETGQQGHDETILKSDADSERSTDDATANTIVRGGTDSETSVTRDFERRDTEKTEVAIPENFGRYAIQKVLGQGAMGAVYLARDTQLDRDVALKIPKFDDSNGVDDEELLARFYREARASATLRSPNICPVYDVGEIDGQHYITMAYIEGRPLKDFTKSKKQHSEKQIATTIRKLATGLEQAHKIGVIHRDLKPANIMVDQQGEPVVMDFGLARRSSSDDVQVTQSGAILGTPAYMAPEQVAGDQAAINHQVDIYALGVIMYELITGEMPFKGNLMAILQQIALNNPTKPSELRDNLDPRLEKICLKMMAGDQKKRYQSMNDVAADLQNVIKHPNRKQKKEAAKNTGPKPKAIPTAYEESNPALISVEQPKSYAEQLRKKKSKPSSKSAKSSTRLPVTSPTDSGGNKQKLLIFGGLGGLILLLGIVFLVRVGKYDVQITLDDPSITLSVDGEVLNIKDGQDVYQLSAGEHKLQLQKDGLKTHVEEFTVSKDGKTALRAVVVNGKLDGLLNGEKALASNAVAPSMTSNEEVPQASSTANRELSNGLAFSTPDAQVTTEPIPINLSQPFTIELWCRPEKIREIESRLGTFQYAFVMGNLELKLQRYHHRPEPQWSCVVAGKSNSGTAGFGQNVPLVVEPGELVHIACQWTGQELQLFQNGSSKNIKYAKWGDSDLDDGEFLKQFVQSSPEVEMKIGSRQLSFNGRPTHFDGVIHQVRVSRTARYKSDFVPKSPLVPDQHTVTLYDFNDGKGETLKDSSGNGRDGQIIGAKWISVTSPQESNSDTFQSGLLFDKPETHVNFGKIPLDLTQPFTAEMWCRPTALRPGLSEFALSRQTAFRLGLFLLKLERPLGVDQARLSFAGIKANQGIPDATVASGVSFVGPYDISAGDLMNITVEWTGDEAHIYVNGKQLPRETSIWGKPRPEMLPFLRSLHRADESPELLLGAVKYGDATNDHFDGEIFQFRLSEGIRFGNEFTPAQKFDRDENTVVLFDFSEGTGDTLHDASGNGHHGKIIGAKWVPMTNASAFNGKNRLQTQESGLLFDTPHSIVDVGELPMQINDPFTIEMWCSPGDVKNGSNSPSYRRAVHLGEVGLRSTGNFRGRNEHRFSIAAGGPSEGLVTAEANPLIVPQERTHVAGQWDGETLSLYINGKKNHQPVGSWGLNNLSIQQWFDEMAKRDGQPKLFIGHQNEQFAEDGAPVHFDGTLFQVRVSRGVRYTRDFIPHHLTTDDQTVALYKFNEGSGDTLHDSSGNGYHGKIIGAKWVTVDGESAVSDRAVAEWILANQGRIRTNVDPDTPIRNIADLPSGAFRIIEIEQLILNMPTAEANTSIQQLGSLDQCRRMSIRDSSLTDEGLEFLQKLPELEDFILIRSRGVTGRGLENLRETNSLRGLSLNGTNIDDAGCQQIARFPLIRFLDLNGSGINDEQLANLKKLKHLDRLWLNSNPITDAGLVHLSGLAKLKDLNLKGTRVTADGIARLRKTLPENASIKWNEQPSRPLKSAPPPAVAPFDAAAAQAHQQAWADYLGVPLEYENSIGMKFRLLPPGEFPMGSTPEEIKPELKVAGSDVAWQQRINFEVPKHQVVLTKPVYIAATEVTQRQYEQIMGNNPAHFSTQGKGKAVVADIDTSNHPVEWVSWYDAADFCAKLSQQEKLKPYYFRSGATVTPLDGTGYRLPTEAEWEFACRAGTTTRFWSGDQDSDLLISGWFNKNSGRRTHAVGELQANPFGLFDVHGNVWEWVQDAWDPKFYNSFQKAAIDPAKPINAHSQRLIRGGNWDFHSSGCRSAYRDCPHASVQYNSLGFRIVLPVETVSRDLLSKSGNGTTGSSRSNEAAVPAIAPFDATAAKAHQQAWAKNLGEPVETTNSIGMQLAVIPPGSFKMGESGETVDVTLTKPFRLGIHVVTQGQWQAVMATEPWKGQVKVIEGDKIPATYVSWTDATEFCHQLTERERAASKLRDGWEYRLPTEAEWEWACRAGTTTRYSFGDDESLLEEHAWFNSNTKNAGEAYSHQVGLKKPNPWGLYDIHGNVWKWCSDWSGEPAGCQDELGFGSRFLSQAHGAGSRGGSAPRGLGVSAAIGGGVGVCVPGRDDDKVFVRGR